MCRQISQNEILKLSEKRERLRANFIKFHEILDPPAPLIKFYKFKAKFKRIMDESVIDQRR